MALNTDITRLMDRILSTKPHSWDLPEDWVHTHEVQTQPDLWGVTLPQWKSAWHTHKLSRQHAAPALHQAAARDPSTRRPPLRRLSTRALILIREKYGTANPYAWKQADDRDAALTSDNFPDAVATSEIPDRTHVPAASRSPSLETTPYADPETLVTLCPTDAASSSSRADPHRVDASSDHHPPDYKNKQSVEKLRAHLENYSTMFLVVDTGYAARRRRGRGAGRITRPEGGGEEVLPAGGMDSLCCGCCKPAESFVGREVCCFGLAGQEEVKGGHWGSGLGLQVVWRTVGRMARRVRR